MNNSTKEDILKELINISAGKSASILSDIVNRKINLSLPEIKIFNSRTDGSAFNQYISKIVAGALMVSSISFREKLTGKANLIFPADKMRHFINLCLNEESRPYEHALDFTDVDFDILKEIGNIILNSIIGEIGNFINIKLEYTLPEVTVLNQANLNEAFNNKDYEYILVLSITFNIENTSILGTVLINLTLESLDEILTKTYEMEVGLNG